MAIPKVCGIENEFGFSVFNEEGKQLNDLDYEIYLEAAHRLVVDFLFYEKAVRYDHSRESRRSSLGPSNERLGLLERAHALLLERLKASDGFLRNGARFYLDGDHPEYSTPECLSPLDLVAYDKASELAIQQAADLFSNRAGNRYRIFLHKNNSDGNGKSYGSHLNVLLSRALVKDYRNYFIQHYVPFQIVRMILIGGGKLGSENGRPPCQFQISQRADFFERLISLNTTEERPIFNTRDEPHADPNKYFRLHDISTDALMCERANFLRVALTQVALAMIEDKFLNENLMPRNPVAAMQRVSRDLKFKDRLLLESGMQLTGLEILRKYLINAGKYLENHPMTKAHSLAVKDGLAMLEALETNPFSTAGRLDWTTAWQIAESRPAEAKKNLWRFREISPRSLYRQLLEKGAIQRLLKEEKILRAKSEAPENTRAYLRGAVIKKFGNSVKKMSWSAVSFRWGSKISFLELGEPFLDKETADVILSNLEL